MWERRSVLYSFYMEYQCTCSVKPIIGCHLDAYPYVCTLSSLNVRQYEKQATLHAEHKLSMRPICKCLVLRSY